MHQRKKSHTPSVTSVDNMFMSFHCSMSVVSAPFDKNTASFVIRNGQYSPAQERILKKLSEQSQFNFEQYQVEHSSPEKNIVIRAGAGTGNMPPIRFHDLRHSCASLLFSQGVSLKEIQAWLGHSTIGTTANIYTHLDENNKLSSANAILSILPEK